MISPEIYPEEKQKANKQTVWEYYFARQIALRIATVLVKIGVTPNLVSFSGMAFGILGAILIAYGNFWFVLLGAIFMEIWLILDKTDGIVARMEKRANKFGEFFEELNGSLIAALFFASIGFAASRFPGAFSSSFIIHNSLFIILGLLTSIFVVFRHLLSRHFETIFGNGKTSVTVSGKGLLAGLYSITIKFSGVYSLAQPLFLLAVIFNFLGLYIAAYFLIQGALVLFSSVYLTLKAYKKQ